MATGMVYHFDVTMQKADGTEKQIQDFSVLAMSHAHAWFAVGQLVMKFMQSPKGRFVTDVQLHTGV